MDILTHTLSGVAIGTVVASFSKQGFTDKLKIVFCSGLGGALPDFDAISLWSGFDATIGNFFQLESSGREIYTGKFWYSHHAFLHSAFAAIVIAFFLGLMGHFIDRRFRGQRKQSISKSFKQHQLLLIGFILGYGIHLIEDMPTPSATWGGVNFFWPSTSYIGGTGDIWWWNNYDIFLIVLSVILLNLALQLLHNIFQFKLVTMCIGVFVIGFSLAFFQIKSRGFDFAYSGNTKNYQYYERKSKEIQKEILGNRLYNYMESFDNSLEIYF